MRKGAKHELVNVMEHFCLFVCLFVCVILFSSMECITTYITILFDAINTFFTVDAIIVRCRNGVYFNQ